MANNDPQLPVITNPYYYGGSTLDPKLGIPNSFYKSQSIDFRSVPSQMSVLPGLTTINSNLFGLITAIDQDLNGVRYGVDTGGWLYQIDTSDNITPLYKMGSAGASGILYNSITDQLYIPSQNTISLYGKLTSNVSSPLWRPDQFAASASNAPGCVNLFNPNDGLFDGATRNNSQGITVGITNSNQVSTNTTATTSVPTQITETTADLCFFNPDIEPFYSINPYIKTKGTGNWTLTLHDSLNNVLATLTVANATLKSDSYNEFKFSSQIRALVNATQTGQSTSYHWHVTSTVAGGTVGCITAGDMTSADFLLFAYALVAPKNGLHPTTMFTGNGVPFLCIGNANYLTTYNFGNDSNPSNSQYVRHQLYFQPGEEVCGVTSNNQYLIVATEKRSTNSSRNQQYGCLYFWDGTTNAPAFNIKIPMGAPYGIRTENGVTYMTISGSLYAWQNGSSIIKVRKVAYESTDYLNAVDNTLVYPNMMASRYGLLLMGYPSTTANPNTTFGIWSWGTVELTYPNSYGLSYTLANGLTNYTSANQLQMGCVYNFVDTMYVSWSYVDANAVTHYGMDRLNNFSKPAPSFNYFSKIWDGQVTYKQKRGARVKLLCLPVPTGYTVKVFYIPDRGTPVYSSTMVPGDRSIVLEATPRFNEVQWGYIGTTDSTATDPLVILDCSMQLDPLEGEENMRHDEVNSITGTT